VRYSLGAIGVVLLLASSGCSISDTDDGAGLIRDAKSRYATLPTFPGATETAHSTTVARGADGGGPVTAAGVVYDFRLPADATVWTVERFYKTRMATLGWKLRERLPGLSGLRAGPVLNYRQGRYSASVNLEGGYDHALEVAVDENAKELRPGRRRTDAGAGAKDGAPASPPPTALEAIQEQPPRLGRSAVATNFSDTPSVVRVCDSPSCSS
jgi:hypothetical protein